MRLRLVGTAPGVRAVPVSPPGDSAAVRTAGRGAAARRCALSAGQARPGGPRCSTGFALRRHGQ